MALDIDIVEEPYVLLSFALVDYQLAKGYVRITYQYSPNFLAIVVPS
jgi:hypothetical protein